jgi:hypothetical protein
MSLKESFMTIYSHLFNDRCPDCFLRPKRSFNDQDISGDKKYSTLNCWIYRILSFGFEVFLGWPSKRIRLSGILEVMAQSFKKEFFSQKKTRRKHESLFSDGYSFGHDSFFRNGFGGDQGQVFRIL